MKARISVLTIGVADLDRSLLFYRDGLGLPTEGIVGGEFEHGAVAFFELGGGLKLAIWAQDDIAHDAGLPKEPISSTTFTIGHNVARRDEVDEVMREAARAGAGVVKPAQETFYGGYAGYFSDPDGHLWEVVWNPNNLPTEPSAQSRIKRNSARQGEPVSTSERNAAPSRSPSASTLCARPLETWVRTSIPNCPSSR